MHAFFFTLGHNPIALGALSGLLAAAHTDYMAFLSWHSATDIKTFQWKVALLRWAQGIIAGAATAAGIFAATS